MNTTQRLPEHAWYAIRWKILQRDQFTCQYCGQYAPNVTLEVDHRVEICDGGTNDESNLVTACRACNRGKEGYRALLTQTKTAIAAQRRGAFHVPDETDTLAGPVTQRVIDELRENQPLSARTIADRIGTTRRRVATLLHRHRGTYFRSEGSANKGPYSTLVWYLLDQFVSPVAIEQMSVGTHADAP